MIHHAHENFGGPDIQEAEKETYRANGGGAHVHAVIQAVSREAVINGKDLIDGDIVDTIGNARENLGPLMRVHVCVCMCVCVCVYVCVCECVCVWCMCW